MRPSKVIIKKYGNRRLYDTSASRYVNLEDVAGMIRDGSDVEVQDARTGEDVTRVILTQIIVDDARGNQAGLPLELLRQLIVASDRARHDFMMWYLRAAFETYKNVQDAVQSQLSEVRSAAAAPLDTMRRFFAGHAATDEQRKKDEELNELRARVAELEEELGKPSRTRTRKSRQRR